MEDKEMVASPAQIPKGATLRLVAYRGRELPSNYHNVVLSRWLNSLKRLNRYFKMIDQDAYYKEYQKYIKAILARPNVIVRLAALEEDIDVIFGWSVYERLDAGDLDSAHILHYIHVQEPYRGQRISRDLIPSDTKWITHVTKHWEEYFMKKRNGKYKDIKFNPFIY